MIFMPGDEATIISLNQHNYAFPPIKDDTDLNIILANLKGYCCSLFSSTVTVLEVVKDPGFGELPGCKTEEIVVIPKNFVARVCISLIEKAGYGEFGYKAIE